MRGYGVAARTSLPVAPETGRDDRLSGSFNFDAVGQLIQLPDVRTKPRDGCSLFRQMAFTCTKHLFANPMGYCFSTQNPAKPTATRRHF